MENLKELQKFALEVRLGALTALKARGFGHVGGCMSAADAVAVLYKSIMKYDPKNPHMADRDKFVCSKGHAGPVVYSALACSGFFPYEDLKSLNQPGTKLPSHCDKHLEGIDATTGSLGQGTSQAVGIALGDKLQGIDATTYLLVGDGELNEGQCWEAAMFTAGKNLTNLVWLIDYNKKQLDGTVDQILPQFDIRKKFEAFGFDAVQVNGNDVSEIYEALSVKPSGKPRAIVLDTIKGAGVKEVEDTEFNHSMNVDQETFDRWIAEVQSNLDKLN